EADHRLVYRADIPGGGFVRQRGGSRFLFHTRHGTGGVGAGSRLALHQRGKAFALSGDFTRVDLPTLVSPPRFAKLLVKIGGDRFSSVLACAAAGRGIRCPPERSALLRGHVTAAGGGPLPGTMLTAFDDGRLESVSVFAQLDGRFVFPRLRPGTYRLRAR